MITSMQLKAHVRNKSKKTGLPGQSLIQHFMMERFIVRISQSSYQYSFVWKGGFLIGSLIGINNRTTMDLDTTITGLKVDEETITKVLNEICEEKHPDGIEFEFEKIVPIREEEHYPGFRASISARLDNMKTPFKLDISTGDAITPKEVIYTHTTMFQKIHLFQDEHISIMSYPIETIMAEKIETILRRGILNTRTRDFYDVYMLVKTFQNDFNWENCSKALMNTMENRSSKEFFIDYQEIFHDIREDKTKHTEWSNYQKNFS